MKQRLLGTEDDDPILSMVNIIDVFLVIIVILFILLLNNPLNPLSHDDVTVIKNPGKENMEIVIKKGEKLEHYKSSSEAGSGQGIKAGITYRLDDGSLIYVPEGESTD
ncbi:DUF2149 domain-containing protein [Methylophaga nitratireducenticrescens]|uniref:Uncharacterized protein n=1 Tax=Methylophaga nitratireducenticrescens TaxID=754476 RepID=I1XH23_METNJ|nr:DUF2149 domain-containing protein [Methylophaga nitratireducenticrescens]AFI83692.1 hypothetical protein Q7A_850 [Methylophaga nitratireducenticrescens]AUZ83819.1 hypothetical protein CDW43_04190 [Methylophaga nitratireducenticrescens]